MGAIGETRVHRRGGPGGYRDNFAAGDRQRDGLCFSLDLDDSAEEGEGEDEGMAFGEVVMDISPWVTKPFQTFTHWIHTCCSHLLYSGPEAHAVLGGR